MLWLSLEAPQRSASNEYPHVFMETLLISTMYPEHIFMKKQEICQYFSVDLCLC